MKKVLSKIIAFVFVVSLLGGAFYGCNSTSNTAAAYSYVSMRINPEVELVVDENNIIESVNPLNQDAETLLSEVNLVGMTLEEGAELVVQLATDAGYIKVDSFNEVYIDVLTQENEDNQDSKGEKIKTALKNRIANFFDNNGIFGKVSQEILDEYLEQAQGLGVSAGKLKLMLRALDLNTDLTLDDIKDMAVKDIISLIKEATKGQNLGYTARQEFKAAREQLRTKYQAMFTLEEEIEGLEEQLENFEGLDEDKELLEATLKIKEEEYEIMEEQYKEELEQLKEEYENKADEIKETRKAEMELRKQEHKQKREEHQQKIKQRAEEVKDQIEAVQEEFEEYKDDLDEQYSEITELKKEIWALKMQLMADLTEESSTQLKAQLQAKQGQLETLEAQYKLELNTMMENYKQQMEGLQQQRGRQ